MKTSPDGLSIINRYSDTYWTEDLEKVESAIDRLVKIELKTSQFSALVSFVSSIGIPAFERSGILRLINNRKFIKAVDGFKDYVEIDNQKDKGLIRRRKAERALFLKPVIVVYNP